MMNTEQARIIDRLREAAKDHGEVATLLEVLGGCYQPGAGASISVSDEDCAYLATAATAAAFVALDRSLKDEE